MTDLSEMPLKHVLILTPTRDGVSSITRRCITALEQLGAGRMDLAGVSDVALARNLLLTSGLDSAEKERTVFLLVDDDMSFSEAQAQLVIDAAEQGAYPVSAVYATSAATLAHTRRPDGRWWSGLGFLAIRREQLLELSRRLQPLRGMNGVMFMPFCQSRASVDGERWLSEDYWFCEQFNGVELLPIGVAHYKAMPISPDQHTLDRIANEEMADNAEAKKESES